MVCIKCGKKVPDGELFCVECSLNDPLLASDSQEVQIPHVAPKGRMQTPQPVHRAKPLPHGPQPQGKRNNFLGGKIALTVMTLLFVAVVVFMLLQYGDVQYQRARLRAKEADLDLREAEVMELRNQIDTLEKDLERAEATAAARELEIQELTERLTGSQSSQNQSSYDLVVKERELNRLKKEHETLQEEADAMETQLKELQIQVTEAENAIIKAKFMDDYVVFVENDNSRYYHTYDCQDFTGSNFWAYSRKLAESNGFRACPVCDGGN